MNLLNTKDSLFGNPIWSDINGSLEQTTNRGVAIDKNINAVKTAIKNILSTPRGADLMDPYFGTDVYKFLFETLDDINMQFLKDVVKNDINSQEPRVSVKIVNIKQNSDTQVDITVFFKLKDSNLEDSVLYSANLNY
jgi:phage baseplate assembly protein W